MIMSMTGYGRAEVQCESRVFQVELKSVNNRNFDCSIRIPRSFVFAEDKIKNVVKSHISRGKIDVFVSVAASENAEAAIGINHSLAAGYVKAVKELAEAYDLPLGLTALDVARYPDVISVSGSEDDEDMILTALLETTEKALLEYDSMRKREGENLRADISSRIDSIEQKVTAIEELSPESVSKYKERLYNKLREILDEKNIDENRILQETAIFADKVAVDEETVRLRSHIQQFRGMLTQSSPVGKNMDFLVQEMNRETNTIGSKCNESAITKIVISIKGEIEKIREQIQNIE